MRRPRGKARALIVSSVRDFQLLFLVEFGEIYRAMPQFSSGVSDFANVYSPNPSALGIGTPSHSLLVHGQLPAGTPSLPLGVRNR